MKEILLTPEAAELKIDDRNDLAGILAVSLKTNTPGQAGFRKSRWLRRHATTDSCDASTA